MGDPMMQEAKRTPAVQGTSRATHEPTRKVVTHDVMGPLQDLATQLDGPDGTHELTEGEHREGLVEQILLVRETLLHWIGTGINHGHQAIDGSDAPPPAPWFIDLLALAGSAVIAGAAGASVVWLSSKFFAKLASDASEGVKAAAKRREKFFEDGLKDGLKKAFRFEPGKPTGSLHELKLAFRQEIDRQCAIAQGRLAQEWSVLHDHLSTLPTPELEKLCRTASASLGDPGMIIGDVGDHTVVAWTNFLARARHGAMRSWDYWEPNGSPGAIKLPDATDPLANGDRRSTIADANIAPKNIDPLLENYQLISNSKDHSGLLQISLDESGRLIHDPGYGMRLDSVGPDVRARMRAMGCVRDLKVNKVVRICSWSLDPPVPIVSFLITADGYIRRSNLGGVRPAADKRDGSTDARLATYAESAQGQSLSHLED